MWNKIGDTSLRIAASGRMGAIWVQRRRITAFTTQEHIEQGGTDPPRLVLLFGEGAEQPRAPNDEHRIEHGHDLQIVRQLA